MENYQRDHISFIQFRVSGGISRGFYFIYLLDSIEARLEKQQRSDVQLSEGLASLGIMGAPLRALLKPLGPSQNYRKRGLRGALNESPIMPTDASLPDSRCEFFQYSSIVFILFHYWMPGMFCICLLDGCFTYFFIEENVFRKFVCMNFIGKCSNILDLKYPVQLGWKYSIAMQSLREINL